MKKAGWERIVHLFTRKRRSDPPVLREKEKGEHNKPRTNKYRFATVNVANHSTHSIAKGDFWASRTIHNTDEERFCVQTEAPVRNVRLEMFGSKFGRAKFRDKFPSRNVIQTGSRNARHFNAPPYDQRSTEWNEEQEEFARHKNHTSFTRSSPRYKGHYKDVHKTKSFRNHVFAQAKKPRLARQCRIFTRDGMIFSQSSREQDYLDGQATFWIFRPPMALWSQTRRRRSTSINVALIYWYSWCKFLRQCYRVGKLYNEFGYSFSWPSDETPRLSKGKNVIECSIENFVSVVAVIKQKALPSMKSSTGKANLEREQEVERTMLDLLQPFTEGLEVRDASSSVPKASYDSKREVFEEQSITENLLSVVTDSGQDTLAKETKSKKGIICPQTRGNRNVFIHYPKDPNCEVCKKTKPTRARCRIKLENRVDGIAISKKFGDLKFDQFRSQNSERWEWAEEWAVNDPVVHNDFTNCIHRFPMKTQGTLETLSC